MTIVEEKGFTQTPAAKRMDQMEFRPARTNMALVVGCALVLRLIVAAFSFHDIAGPSADHGQFGAEMGWVARSVALGQGFSSPFLPNTGPTALVPPLYPYLLAQIFRVCGI